MAQSLPHPSTGEPTYFTQAQWREQGELFSLLPRQLPIYKAGPEDDSSTRWLSLEATPLMH